MAQGGDASGPGSGGKGGAITLSASFGDIIVGAFSGGNTVSARGGNSSISGSGGNGGAISIAAGGDVLIGDSALNVSVFTRGGRAAAGNGGNGGTISITGASVITDGGVSSVGGDALLGPAGTTTGGTGGNAGAISITATSGDIFIGTTPSTNSFLGSVFVSDIGVAARGGSTDGTANAGNGAAVVLSAPSGSITAGTGFPTGIGVGVPLSFNGSILTQGGDNISTIGGNGGKAGAISVLAGGSVTLGTLNADEAAGIASAVSARGGNAAAGQGGNAASVSITGASLALSGVYDQGGASAATATGGSGGHITLGTTGGTGQVVVLAYAPGSGAGPGLDTDGGFAGGTQTGKAGSIEIDGNVVATAAATLGAGTPTLSLSSVGAGGTPFILVTGSMDASAPFVEALRIDSTGQVTVLGPIGATTPFASVTIIGE
jgi:hypothetical protein